MQRLTFRKNERPCSKILLDRLFTEGKSVFSYPFKFIFITVDHPDKEKVRVVFSVPKRNFKQAVKRNLIRRRMREAYRLNKDQLVNNLGDKQIILMVLYADKEILDYHLIESNLLKGFKKTASFLNKQ